MSRNDVQPLHIAEDRFLQILVSKFDLTRHTDGAGIELSFQFDDNTPAIWDQEGKRYLRSVLPIEKRKRFQQSLDEFMFGTGGSGSYHINDPEFFFRYASGGTLLRIHFDGDDHGQTYYCFFYRDVHPIGWNIANGGTDTRAELLNPQETIDRELSEELIIADFDRNLRYVFPSDESKPLDHPTQVVARLLWKRRFPDRNLEGLETRRVDVDWISGPDSLRVRMGQDTEIRRDGFFLNVNGEDFGIEFDRAASIRLPKEVTLFGGEIDGGRLINCPVGLFKTDRFIFPQQSPQPGYMPDFFYFGDKKYDDGRELTDVLLNEFVEHMRWIRTENEIDEFEAAIRTGRHLYLCPVTEKIVRRYTQFKDS